MGIHGNIVYESEDLFSATLVYPYDLKIIDNRVYNFEYKNKLISFLIFHHSNVLEIHEYDNKFERFSDDNGYRYKYFKDIQQLADNQIVIYKNETKSEENIRFLFDTHDDSGYRTTKQKVFSHIFITFEAEEGMDFLEFTKEVLSYFFKSYRYVMNDTRLRDIDNLKENAPNIYYCFNNYDSQDDSLELVDRLMRRDRKNNLKLIEYPDEIFYETEADNYCEKKEYMLNEYLINGKKKNWHDIVSKANELLVVNNEYNLCILESFIAVEFFISEYLFKQKLLKGVSKEKLKNFSKDISISYMLNVEIPMFIEDLTDQKRTIVAAVDRVRKIRNNIVHNGKKASEEDAEESISSVKNLFILLESESSEKKDQ